MVRIKEKMNNSNVEVFVTYDDEECDYAQFELPTGSSYLCDADGEGIYENLQDYLEYRVPENISDRDEIIALLNRPDSAISIKLNNPSRWKMIAVLGGKNEN